MLNLVRVGRLDEPRSGLFFLAGPYNKPKRLILVDISDHPVEKCFKPVAVANQRKKMHKQPNEPGNKTPEMDMMRKIGNSLVSSNDG